MGNTLRRPIFRVGRRRNVDGCPHCPNSTTEYVYVDTIRDANFSWLEGRRVSADDFYPLVRDVETDRVAILMHDIFKYILKGNASAPLSSVQRCLHIGSGHYIWLVEMANDYREVQFEGFDIKPKDVNMDSLPTNVTFTHGNIFEDGLPYPDEHFDYVNVRSLLAWLPSDKISFVINEIRRVTKRGGWIEILEVDPILKNTTPYYEENLGTIWRDFCNCKGYDNNNIIKLDGFLERGFTGIKMSKLSIPVGYGGKIGELYAEAFITATNTLASASGMMEKLNMTNEAIQEYLQKCVKGLGINRTYTNVYLVTATKNFR